MWKSAKFYRQIIYDLFHLFHIYVSTSQEMQVHLADVARFSRFCDGMLLGRCQIPGWGPTSFVSEFMWLKQCHQLPHVWWSIAPIYGDLGDGLLLFSPHYNYNNTSVSYLNIKITIHIPHICMFPQLCLLLIIFRWVFLATNITGEKGAILYVFSLILPIKVAITGGKNQMCINAKDCYTVSMIT